MYLKWLEDFLILASTRSFSRAAEMRHVTQSAFSRRIQSLEHWAGRPLFVRGKNPIELTEAGKTLHLYAARVLRCVENARDSMGDDATDSIDVVEMSVPSLIENAYFPVLHKNLELEKGGLNFRLKVQNCGDVVRDNAESKIDFWFDFWCKSLPNRFSISKFEALNVGSLLISPFVGAKSEFASIDESRLGNVVIPYISHSKDSYLERVIEDKIYSSGVGVEFCPGYESNNIAILASLANSGDGAVFLDCDTARYFGLVPLLRNDALSIQLEIHVYREKNMDFDARKPILNHVWKVLERTSH